MSLLLALAGTAAELPRALGGSGQRGKRRTIIHPPAVTYTGPMIPLPPTATQRRQAREEREEIAALLLLI